jgi:type I restriction enzyme R subunit
MDINEFQTMVIEAVVDNQDAHNTMADYFFSDGPGIAPGADRRETRTT